MATSCRSASAAAMRRLTRLVRSLALHSVRPACGRGSSQSAGGPYPFGGWCAAAACLPRPCETCVIKTVCVELFRFDRSVVLQPARMGNTGRPRGGRLESVDPGRDRRSRGKPGVDSRARWESLALSACRHFPRTGPRRYQSCRRSFRGDLHLHAALRGWRPASGVVAEDLVRHAMTRASAAAALVLDHTDFGFPTPGEVELALGAGGVA